MQGRRLFLFTLVALAIASCKNSSFEVLPTDGNGKAPDSPSAESTDLWISPDNYADGVTPAQVQITVRTRQGFPVVGMAMNITVTDTQNVVVPCTATDSTGLSRCWIYSTKAENKMISIWGEFTKTIDIVFKSPQPLRHSFAIVGAGSDQTAMSGHRIISTAGTVEAPFIQKDSNGVTRLKTTVLGSMIND